MAHYKNQVSKGAYFFVSLEVKGKAPVFRDAFFKTKVERRWMLLMSQYPHTAANEFVVNDNAVHAMVTMAAGVKTPEEQLHKMVGQFQQIVLEDWKIGHELWSPVMKIRRITSQDERDSLRDFIVQKMLGGKELSLIEGFDGLEGNYWNDDN